MGSRWKGKGLEAKTLAEPMSKIVSALQSSLTISGCKGLILECSVLLVAEPELSELPNRACFGRFVVTSQKWYELSLEEAFYLCCSLKCLMILGNDGVEKSDPELCHYMSSRVETFPELYKAYSHLMMKTWAVRSGSQYGVDYVCYCHHPALVHSEFSVLVLFDRNSSLNGRLRVWSDLYRTIWLSGGVAKTLLVLRIEDYGSEAYFPTCMKNYGIRELTISRWIPEQTREVKEKEKK